ncbi:MAG: UDP-N-acetylmuramate dehydrogenase [Gammaproteobacteria bacterium]
MFSLVSYHSFGFSCSAKTMVSIEKSIDLPKQFNLLKNSQFYILGEGSNTVFLDDFQGTIVKIDLQGIVQNDSASHHIIKVGAGQNWHQFTEWCLDHHIYGLENLALIPGSVGAAPIQNIGAYGVEVERFIHKVEYFDLDDHQFKTIFHQDCEFGYRESVFKKQSGLNVVITSVEFSVPKLWKAISYYGELKELINPSPNDIFNKVVEVRQSKLPDPAKIGNAGSFFKNPVITLKHYIRLQQTWPSIPSYPVNKTKVKVPAAWLIDQLGFKGKNIGGIGCHPTQALVLTNDGSGTGEQLLQLARAIKAAVLSDFSIVLENEVRLIGKNGPVIL